MYIKMPKISGFLWALSGLERMKVEYFQPHLGLTAVFSG